MTEIENIYGYVHSSELPRSANSISICKLDKRKFNKHIRVFLFRNFHKTFFVVFLIAISISSWPINFHHLGVIQLRLLPLWTERINKLMIQQTHAARCGCLNMMKHTSNVNHNHNRKHSSQTPFTISVSYKNFKQMFLFTKKENLSNKCSVIDNDTTTIIYSLPRLHILFS